MENGLGGDCTINTGSSATLNLNPGDVIEKAYLYWAGSGTGDFDVKLNTEQIIAERTFAVTQSTSGLPFFSAFADVTQKVQLAHDSGNMNYDFSDLDLTAVIGNYCGNATNFGGWAIIVVYKNPSLPLNQLNVYDGLQYVPDSINITLSNLNVIDNVDAKIGFLAWEGDQFLSIDETLRINGNPIGNPPLNPVNNAFNGTNSFTGSTTLYNMDLDVYNVQNNINIGDTSALIQLSSGRDFVMINSIVTKFNSQLPDATVVIDNVGNYQCDSREITVDYTVFNVNSTDPLPASTPIAVYADGILIKMLNTSVILDVGESEIGQIILLIPDGIPLNFDLQFVVDDNGTGVGIVTELNENNNSDSSPVSLWVSPTFNVLENKEGCNLGFGRAVFDFSAYEGAVKIDQTDVVRFYTTLEDAENEVNPILNPTNFTVFSTPVPIFVRIDNEHCFSITSFLLIVKNCPPVVYNFVSADNDSQGYNNSFHVDGLYTIFLNFKTSIYNRWGVLVWTGDHSAPEWDGYASKGLVLDNNQMPAGTYYYVIELNDPENPKPLTGFLYLTR
ncbi:gliding motility-associated C-terminal domain-containing protein [Flavobacterium sp. GT3R68]|uniref:T9SS type B sorting domain-containing protein n=1 Tax=Flavobacterium sp. GT3R68 TaxID=2594437 RepID=UPI002106F166|nr:gliding motility-associated C-terminal domain-containing protein [Flavobacterium sp. GT3R68]